MLWAFKYVLMIYTVRFGTIVKYKLGIKDM